MHVTASKKFLQMQCNLCYCLPLGASGRYKNQDRSERVIAAAVLCDGSKWRQSGEAMRLSGCVEGQAACKADWES